MRKNIVYSNRDVFLACSLSTFIHNLHFSRKSVTCAYLIKIMNVLIHTVVLSLFFLVVHLCKYIFYA